MFPMKPVATRAMEGKQVNGVPDGQALLSPVGEGAPLASVKHNAHTVVLLVRPLPTADGNWVKVMMILCSSLPRIIIHFPALLATVYVLLYMYGRKHIL